MALILASQSPRRKTLMELFSVPFTVRVADIDEAMDPSLSPSDEVARVSQAKAFAVPHDPGDVVVSADTIVVYHGNVLGKPVDEAHAVEMLSLLSGARHQVMTGVTVLKGDRAESFTEITDVDFRPLTQKEILAYVRTGEPMDKAGAYGIQGGAALFVNRLEGDYYNVVGLPVYRLGQVLKNLAPEIMEETI